MKMFVFLLLFDLYYFMISGFIWCIAPHFEFSEIASFSPVILFGGTISIIFAVYSTIELAEKGKL